MDKFTVRSVDGSVDVAASSALYAERLSQWVAQNEVTNEQIEDAVSATFSEHKSIIPTDAMVNMVLNKLGTTPTAFASVSKRVRAYLKSQRDAGKLHLVLGPHGGLVRNLST
jgi:hypothetical protein